jgi:lysophospholipase L1-like esterase
VRRLRWLVYAALLTHGLLAVLLLGRNPLLFRAASSLLSEPPPAPGGMRLALYGGLDRSGRGRFGAAPDSIAPLETPHASLDAYAVWHVREGGAYTLVFHCDQRGAVFVDGHRVIGLIGTSANNVGRATIDLDAGRHFLVVYLSSGAGPGWFRLEAEPPGEGGPALLSPADLEPVQLRYAPQMWRWALAGRAWVSAAWSWLVLVGLLGAALALQEARSVRQAVRHATLIAASSALALGVGEMAARLVFTPPPRVSFRASAGQAPAAERRDVFMVPTERGFRHNPNSEVVVEGSPVSPDVRLVYRTNALGYRNPPIGPKHGRRILFLGDSITFGLGVNEEHTFVRRIEDLAGRDGRHWETVNAAVNGLGTNGEIAVLHETGLSVEPDVVVLGFYLNDFLESPGIYLRTLPGVLDRSVLAHQVAHVASRYLLLAQSTREARDSPPMLKAPDEIFAWRDEFRRHSTVMPRQGTPSPATARFNALVLRFFEDWGGAFSPHVWPEVEALLAEYVRVARRHAIRPVIVAFPVRYQMETMPLPDYPQQRLREITGRLEVPYLDLLPRLRSEDERGGAGHEPLYLDHCHLTPRGHAVVAEAIYEFLGRAGRSDAGNRRAGRPGGSPLGGEND